MLADPDEGTGADVVAGAEVGVEAELGENAELGGGEVDDGELPDVGSTDGDAGLEPGAAVGAVPGVGAGPIRAGRRQRVVGLRGLRRGPITMTNTPGTTVPPWLAPHTHQLAAERVAQLVEQRAWFTGGSLTEDQLRGPQTP